MTGALALDEEALLVEIEGLEPSPSVLQTVVQPLLYNLFGQGEWSWTTDWGIQDPHVTVTLHQDI